MTENQRLFAEEYLKDRNATRAYKAVYKNVKKDESARANGSRLLTNDSVKAYIKAKLDEMHDENTADAKEVLEYLTSVMRGKSTAEIVVVVGVGDGESKPLKMEKAPDEKERLKAGELLGKVFGLFRDKVDVSAAAAVTIVDDLGDDDG